MVYLSSGNLDALGVSLVVQAGADLESWFGSSRANALEHGFIALQRFGRPVGGDEGKQTVFDGIPLRGAGGIMTNSDLEVESVTKTFLQLLLP